MRPAKRAVNYNRKLLKEMSDMFGHPNNVHYNKSMRLCDWKDNFSSPGIWRRKRLIF
ncbi:MAG: hypothetical protein V3T96_02165 [Thermodesulfobacteriota bacterium]